MMLPKTFQEFEIRLYLKKPVSKELTDKLRRLPTLTMYIAQHVNFLLFTYSIFDDFCKTCEHENPAVSMYTTV